MLTYPIGSSGQQLLLSDSVLEHLWRHRQVRWYYREAGGQLFAHFALPDIVIVEATGPRRSDWRTPVSYFPDRKAEQAEILEKHSNGLHFIGNWHTHPQALPSPSLLDTRSMLDEVNRSQHSLNGMICIIVGRAHPPEGLHVSIADGCTQHRLFCTDEV